MGILAYFLLALIAAVAAVLLISAVIEGLRSYWKYRGQRLIVCPENHQTASVDIDTLSSLYSGLTQSTPLRLSQCSRWPEMQGCGQECLSQIESSPHDCLVRTIVTNWYSGKACAVCGELIHEVEWMGHKPALLDVEGKTVFWDEIQAEQLPEVFKTHSPVCWDCHIASALMREHSDVVTYRPWTPR